MSPGLGTLTDASAKVLHAVVKARLNVLVSGGTGAGKTTMLNLLSGFIPTTERIVTIEDSAELRLNQRHVVSLEARPAQRDGEPAVTIRHLVVNALRMRPERIIVGECRSGETLDMLQAMNTGHDGSLTTLHANTPRDALSRMETMVMMAGMDLPIRVIREQVASAMDLIVQQARLREIQPVKEDAHGVPGERAVARERVEAHEARARERGRRAPQDAQDECGERGGERRLQQALVGGRERGEAFGQRMAAHDPALFSVMTIFPCMRSWARPQ